MDNEPVTQEPDTQSSGNALVDLGLSPEEAALLSMRAMLMDQLRTTIKEHGWTQAEAARIFGVSQSRVSDLVRGKWERFSIDMLVMLACRAGKWPRLIFA